MAEAAERCSDTVDAFAGTEVCSLPARGLIDALAAAEGAVDKRSNVPILTMVRIEAADGWLSVMATDHDQEMTVRTPCDGELDAVCVSPGVLRGVLAGITKDVELSRGAGNTLGVKAAGLVDAELDGLPAEDFPDLPDPDDEEGQTVCDGGVVQHALRLTASFVGQDEVKPYLTGVCHDPEVEKDERLTATSGHKLATTPSPFGGALPKVLIPTRAVQRILALPDDEDWTIIAYRGRWRISGEAWTYRFKLLDHEFPDWRRVVPSDQPLDVVCDRASLKAAVGRVLSMVADKGHSIVVEAEKNGVTVREQARTTGMGAARCSVIGQSKGDAIRFGVNAKYLLDVIGNGASGKDVTFRCASPADPILIEESAVTMVVMPLRVN